MEIFQSQPFHCLLTAFSLCSILLTFVASKSESGLEAQKIPFSIPLKPMLDDDAHRIIGGVEAGLHEFPSIISLQYQSSKDPSKYNHICTGSIVNENWIVTAGHCSPSGPSGLHADKYRVVAGAFNLYNFTGSEKIRSVQQAYAHPLYFFISTDYDISMMLVDTPFEFNEFVQPVKLAPKKYTVTGGVLTSGWGLTNKNATAVPAKLQKINLPAVDWEKCREQFAEDGSTVTTRMLCAGGEKDRNVCHGDSGGPVYSTDENEELILSAITSWGKGCADEGWPSVFTNSSYFNSWIKCIAAHETALGSLDNAGCAVGQAFENKE